MVFSCTLPPSLQPPLYPLKAAALAGGGGGWELPAGSLQPSTHCMVLARSSVSTAEQLPHAQRTRGAPPHSLQAKAAAPDMRIVPCLLTRGAVQRYPALAVQVRPRLACAPPLPSCAPLHVH